MVPYKHTKFQVESRQGAGLVSKRNTKREKIADKREKTRKNAKKHEKIAMNRRKNRKELRKIAGKNREKSSNCEKSAKKSPELCARDMRTTRAVCVRPADHRSHTRATCGPLEPCARNMRTTGAVRARPGDHKSCPSEAPGRALARTRAKRGRITIEPQNHRTTGP